jgi:hypothetical protein
MTQISMGWRLIAAMIWGLTCLFVACSHAQARPRDDVMAGAYRCAAIADSRQWLDCYYGAAQPARMALGLPSATPQQLDLLSSPPSGGQPADIALRDQVMAGATGCYALATERTWLDCYYGAAQPLRARLGLTPVLQAMSQRLAMPPVPVSRQPRVIAAHMTVYSFDSNGIFTVTLDNGQVWRQLSGDTSFARWNKPASSYSVTISPGLLGSHNMRVPGTGHSFKVELVQ